MNRDMSVAESDQCCALGAAIFAAAAAGEYRDVHQAKAAMLSPIEKTYKPDPQAHAAYKKIYKDYQVLGAFAGQWSDRT